jgi:hypothetical protein
MMSRSQMPRARAPRKISTKNIPVIENVESNNNLLGTSQNSIQAPENSPRKKISTISQLSIPETPTRKNSQNISPDSPIRKSSAILQNQWASLEYPPRHKISTISQHSIQEKLNNRLSQYSMPDTPTKKTSINLSPQTSYNSRQNSQEWGYM